MKEKQLMYNDVEIGLIKQYFAENDSLLKMMRKLFFGFDLEKEEADVIKKTFAKPELVGVVQRKIHAELSLDSEIGNVNDFWLGAETQVFGAQRDTIEQAVVSKQRVLDMFNKAIALLSNPNGEKVDISYDIESLKTDPLQTNLIARNLYIKAIETALFTMKTIAGQKTESVEETVKRLKKDSAR